MDGMLYYEKAPEAWDSIKVKLRTRGDFRLKKCFFAPLRVKIKKKNAKGTLFEGNKALKLVLPCLRSKDNNSLIVKEYMCYKIYEKVTPYSFSTRLLNIDLKDQSGKTEKEYQLTGFFIEDDDLVAKRFHGKVIEDVNLHPRALQDTTAVQLALFQYLIANIDWSTTFYHNTKLIQTREPFRNIPLTYDFDISGFVNPPYATLNPQFNMTSARDRVYRGFCRSDNVVSYVRNQYIQLEGTVVEILNEYEDSMSKGDFASLEKFVMDFFEVMKDDKLFDQNIIQKCRQ